MTGLLRLSRKVHAFLEAFMVHPNDRRAGFAFVSRVLAGSYEEGRRARLGGAADIPERIEYRLQTW